MDRDALTTEIQTRCRRLCRDYHLESLYVTQILGRRRHYLGGYGPETFDGAHSRAVTEGIALFWQGTLSERDAQTLVYGLVPWAKQIEKTLQAKADA